MIKTTKQYLNKMKQLRKKRDYHFKKYAEFKNKMDNLEIDKSVAESKIQKGKYYKIDDTKKGGNIYYIHVKKIEKGIRGLSIIGHAFHQTTYNFGLFVENHFRIIWDNLDNVVEITDNEYYSAYNNILQQCNIKFFEEEI